MKTTSFLLALLFAGPAWAVNVVPDAPTNPSPAVGRANPAPLPMKFVKVPLGNVTRILSAKFNVQISIVANARAPITGDFSSLELRAALAEAARQAGLVVTALGPDSSAGFSLAPPETKAADAGAASSVAAATPSDPNKAELEAAARQRAELLRQRETLLEQLPPLDPQG